MTDKFNAEAARKNLQQLAFTDLFIDNLGWRSGGEPERRVTAGGVTVSVAHIARLSGLRAYEITAADGDIPAADTQQKLWKEISKHSAENVLIFLNRDRTASLWFWMRREPNGKLHPRRHAYIKGQPGDLFLSKLAAMYVDFAELDADGEVDITKAAERVRKGLDIETVTKKFFAEFEGQHGKFLENISGIPADSDRRWYASVILNRLMFIWFLQKKGFLGRANLDYLPGLLADSQRHGKNIFFTQTLRDLFFEGFAKPEKKRQCVGQVKLGEVPYLNGGLFIPHGIEQRVEGDSLHTAPFAKIKIPDAAFAEVFALFSRYTWHLNDTPGAADDEINPDVLGYIFEKYINQKEFGAYYTRPEITEYLCERTVHQLILDAAKQHADTHNQLIASPRGYKKDAPPLPVFDSVPELLLRADGHLCRELLTNTLPKLSLLDPACGSGAFLVAAMKTLLNVYAALHARCEAVHQRDVLEEFAAEQKKHQAPLGYWLKKKIITENLYGVDIMEEAVEIAKLRLFLALVASVDKCGQLEPLPNIEFNLMPGNSLIGLLQVDAAKYDGLNADTADGEQKRLLLNGTQGRRKFKYQPADGDLAMTVETTAAPSKNETVGKFVAQKTAAQYAGLLRKKNLLIGQYKNAALANKDLPTLRDLSILKKQIEDARREAYQILNKLLLDDFQSLGIHYEQATWDADRQREGKPEKRALTVSDIEAMQPFHWAYEFDEIIVNRGGFDAIITNPPWEIFKPNSKEFFLKYSDIVSKKKMRIEEFEDEKAGLLKDADTRCSWLDYLSSFPHLSEWYRNARQFKNQIGIVSGKKVGSDINLYKLFTEQTLHLLRKDGYEGIVIPSGIYTDLGAMQLRKMLFEQHRITGLFGFDNRKNIFDNVDSTFKFVLLSVKKDADGDDFPAAFMRVNVSDLASFPADDDIVLEVPLIKKMSPHSYSIMEFKSKLDIQIAEKMLQFPLLGEADKQSAVVGHVQFTREFDMTNDSGLFVNEPAKGRLPLYEGKMIWQFEHQHAKPRYWIDEKKGREKLLGKTADSGQKLDYQDYRLGFRDIAKSRNERTFISTIIPPAFHGNKIPTVQTYDDNGCQIMPLTAQLFLCSIWNSFVLDWLLRMKVTFTLNYFYLYQLPIPRLTEQDAQFLPLAERAARLIGTTAEYDALLREVFGAKATHQTHGVTADSERRHLRAEIDALVAHLYHLTESEFQHILSTFPLVPEPIIIATANAYRDYEKGLIK